MTEWGLFKHPLRTCAEAYRTARLDALIEHQKRLKLLRDEITRLEFANKEERETIDELSGLITTALKHVLEDHSWFTSTSDGARWIEQAKELIGK